MESCSPSCGGAGVWSGEDPVVRDFGNIHRTQEDMNTGVVE